jgi:pimeloyl-ACP methyl ester carboxylesterase
MNLPAPTTHLVTTPDGVPLRLTRYQGGKKGPVLVAHGLGVWSGMFALSTVKESFLQSLVDGGYDVFLLDWRASIQLPVRQFTLDDAAEQDVPAAVDAILEVSGAASLEAVVHCAGASSFYMALAEGLLRGKVRCVACSQIALHYTAPAATAVKSFLHLPDALDSFGFASLSPEEDPEHPRFQALWTTFVNAVHHECDSSICHRLTFMYGHLYRHDKMNPETHARLAEQFGRANLTSFRHLAQIMRRGEAVKFDYGKEENLRRYGSAEPPSYVRPESLPNLAIPMTFLTGSLNGVYLPPSTERTYDWLRQGNPGVAYRRVVAEGYGHIDCIMGSSANVDCYPALLAQLEACA